MKTPAVRIEAMTADRLSSDVVSGHIAVRGAREHNLRAVDIDIPATRSSPSPGSRVRASRHSPSARSTPSPASATSSRSPLRPPPHRPGLGSPRPRHHRTPSRRRPPTAKQSGGTRSTVGTVSRVSNVLRMLYSRSGTYPEGYRPADLAGTFPAMPPRSTPTASPRTPRSARAGRARAWAASSRSTRTVSSVTRR